MQLAALFHKIHGLWLTKNTIIMCSLPSLARGISYILACSPHPLASCPLHHMIMYTECMCLYSKEKGIICLIARCAITSTSDIYSIFYPVLQIEHALQGCSIKNVALLVLSHVIMSTALHSSALSSVCLAASVKTVLCWRMGLCVSRQISVQDIRVSFFPSLSLYFSIPLLPFPDPHTSRGMYTSHVICSSSIIVQIGHALQGCSIKNVALLVPSHVIMSTALHRSALSSVCLAASVKTVLCWRMGLCVSRQICVQDIRVSFFPSLSVADAGGDPGVQRNHPFYFYIYLMHSKKRVFLL